MVNRNLMRFTDSNRRQKTMKLGKLQTVALLNDLPKTKHDMASFTVDLTICTSAFFDLTVNGIFKEVVSDVCRYFSKTMIIVPCGTGVCIVNEMLHVTNPSKELIKVCRFILMQNLRLKVFYHFVFCSSKRQIELRSKIAFQKSFSMLEKFNLFALLNFHNLTL